MLLTGIAAHFAPFLRWLNGIVIWTNGMSAGVSVCSCGLCMEAGMTKMVSVAGMLWLTTAMYGERLHINTVALF